jgi:hypothetical protein
MVKPFATPEELDKAQAAAVYGGMIGMQPSGASNLSKHFLDFIYYATRAFANFYVSNMIAHRIRETLDAFNHYPFLGPLHEYEQALTLFQGLPVFEFT